MSSAFGRLLDAARRDGRCVGAFTCYDLAGFEAVVVAAELRQAPVVILLSPSSFAGPAGARFGRAVSAAAHAVAVPVLVQLDHSTEACAIRRVRDAGLGAVLADASDAPLDDNIAFVRAARHAVGPTVGLEAELGRVEGHEDRAASTTSGSMTAPDEAAHFVASTDIDCLAVAVGNVHGHYAGPPELDIDRLEAIAAVVDLPLALHGASGLPETQLRRAIATGVAKMNFNTELRDAYFRALISHTPARGSGLDLRGLHDDVRKAVSHVVAAKLEMLGWSAKQDG